jgi:hypothetical protein
VKNKPLGIIRHHQANKYMHYRCSRKSRIAEGDMFIFKNNGKKNSQIARDKCISTKIKYLK